MISPVEEKYTFNQWRLTTNEIIITMGDLLNLQTTEKTTVVGALNELDDAVKGRYGIEFITDFDKQHPLSVTRINATGSAPNNLWGATLLQRTATGTVDIPAAPIANTTMGGIVVEGYSGAQWGVSSKIISVTPANWSQTSQPSGWKMYTTDINSINTTLALELFPSGRVGIYGPLDDGVNELQVNGTIKATSIENTSIGAVTPASAAFTTANATLFNGSGAGLTSIPNGALVNSTIIVGSTTISLGGTSTVLVGLTSVTSTSFVGALTGNASSATTLQTTRAINGVNFNGSAAITVPVNTTNDITTAVTVYPTFVPLSTAGNQSIKTSSTKLSFVPSTGILSAIAFDGNGALITALNAGNISTGILSTARGGTGTASTTGTGSNVFSISPALTGIPTAPTANVADTSTQIASTAFVKAVLTAGAAVGAAYGGDVSIAPLSASALLHLNKPLGIYSAAIKFEDQGVEKYILGYSNVGSVGVSDFSLYNLVPVTPVNVLTVFGDTSNVAIGNTTDNGYKLDVTGTARVSGDLTVDGGLTVNGTVTTINSTQIRVDDINIELGAITTPTDTTANGGGITLLGATNKTFNWTSTGANWTSSENISLATGKVFKINNVQVLSNIALGSTVVSSSLTSVGVLNAGSISNGFGNINIGSNSIIAGTGTFSGAVSGTTGTFTGTVYTQSNVANGYITIIPGATATQTGYVAFHAANGVRQGYIGASNSVATTINTGTIPYVASIHAFNGAVTVTSSITANSFSGNGSALTSLNASQLTTGTIPDARISGSYTGLTNLTGTGTVDFAKFLGNAGDVVTSPSFSWTGDTNTGIYRPAASQIGIAIAGVQRGLFSSSGLTVTGIITGTLSGNASTATTLQTARTINGVSFNGSANITVADSTKLPLTGGTLTGNLVTSTQVLGGSGKIGITVNDGTGNANVTFNHYAGIPTISGSSGRITVTTDTTTASMSFQLASNVTSGTAAGLSTILTLTETDITAARPITGSLIGNASTATTLQTARTINGVSFNGSANITVADATKVPFTIGSNTIDADTYVSNVGFIGVAAASTNTPASVRGTLKWAQETNTNNLTQTFQTIQGNNELYIRSRYGAVWSAWSKMLHDGNYNSYAPTLTGTGATGTWSINVTGNAASATTLQTARTINGVSFNGSANITVADSTKLPLTGGTLTGSVTFNGGASFVSATSFSSVWASVAYNARGGSLEVTGSGGAAMMSFHRPGQYAVNFGLDNDNVLKVGGWSMGNASYRVLLDMGTSLATTGYTILSNGLIFQWGTYTGAADIAVITFPVAMSACLNVQLSKNTTAFDTWDQTAYNVTGSSFTLRTNAASRPSFWFAIGY